MTDTQVDELDQVVQYIAQRKGTLDEYEDITKQLKAEIDNVKPIIADHFAETGNERIRKYGVVIYKTDRTSQTILDSAALKELLIGRGQLEQYTRQLIDVEKVIAELAHVPEVAALIRTTTNTSVAVKLDTKGK